ncbi:(5-formylfuran-3-yl)methyl phosphate synthase [Methylocapsa palsarum]|nr:(5-formylfuran-3-yl)methyl phosphate synthase [Methylocapsa palsarum]
MTLMLASVTDPAEAEAVWAGGADIIDLKDPANGALGALDPALAATIVRQVAKRKPVSAAAGALFADPDAGVEAVAKMAAAGCDYVKIGFSSDQTGADGVRALAPIAARTKLVGVLFADKTPDLELVALMAAQGFAGAMLDTAAKNAGRLLDHMDVAALNGFIGRCNAHGLASGLAGSLEPPDIPRLLPMRPGYLGFRGSLCQGRTREAAIDAGAVRMIRDLIPQAQSGRAAVDAGADLRFFFGRGYIAANERAIETDRVFVHDLIMPCFIGAYDYERGMKQNVRFNVDVDVRRSNHHSDDMRDIFSYDVVIDAIKILLGQGHVELVETLARELADSVLRHPEVVRVCVRIEKLDIIPGRVGVEIRRERASEAAAVDQLATGFASAGGKRSH